MARVILGLGGNLGSVSETFRRSLESLEGQGQFHVLGSSSLWRSPSWGFSGPDFLNAVVAVETEVEPRDLLEALLQEEAVRGRLRGRAMGDRPVDLDILSWEGRQVDEPGLTIPHPGMTVRDFVLLPLVELAPETLVNGATARSYQERLGRDGNCSRLKDTDDWRDW